MEKGKVIINGMRHTHSLVVEGEQCSCHLGREHMRFWKAKGKIKINDLYLQNSFWSLPHERKHPSVALPDYCKPINLTDSWACF